MGLAVIYSGALGAQLSEKIRHRIDVWGLLERPWSV